MGFGRQNGELCRAVSGRSYCFLSVYVLNCDLLDKNGEKEDTKQME